MADDNFGVGLRLDRLRSRLDLGEASGEEVIDLSETQGAIAKSKVKRKPKD